MVAMGAMVKMARKAYAVLRASAAKKGNAARGASAVLKAIRGLLRQFLRLGMLLRRLNEMNSTGRRGF
jgi:hypothetical protein